MAKLFAMFRRLPARLLPIFALLPTPVSAAVGAALVAAPTLFAGFILDDHIHLLTLDGQGFGAEPFDLFRFGSGDPGQMEALIHGGPYPWYTLPSLKIHFFRPLSSALMVLDRALFGEQALWYHLHNVLWYVLLVWGVALVYHRALAGPMAALAALLFVLDETHIVPTLWWSNRNALVAAAPAVLGLAAHLRWREAGWRPGLPLSLMGYALGLTGGEGALGILGYVLAYELFARQEHPLRRLRAFAPGLALAAVYLAFYKYMGYGVKGSGIYFDPVAEWPAFLANAPGRLVELVGTQFFGTPVETAVLSNGTGTTIRVVSVALVTALAVALRQLWKGLPPEERRAVAWLGTGALIATVPGLATFPAGRLLVLPSIGACAVMALVIQYGFVAARKPGMWMLREAAKAFVLIQVVFAPLPWIAASIGIPLFISLTDDAFREIELDPDTSRGQLVFSFCSADAYTGMYPPPMRRRMGYPEMGGWQCFSVAPYDHEITRTGERRFEIRVVDGELLSTPFERLVRSPAHPFVPGDTLDLGAYRIEILETGRWGPSRFAVELDFPLEDPRYRFLAWKAGVLAVFDWPPVGESTVISTDEGYFAWQHFKKRLPLL